MLAGAKSVLAEIRTRAGVCEVLQRPELDAVRLPEPSLFARHLVVAERGDLLRPVEAHGHPLRLRAHFPNTALIFIGRDPARPERGLLLLLQLLHAEDYTISRARRVTAVRRRRHLSNPRSTIRTTTHNLQIVGCGQAPRVHAKS